MSLLTDTDLSKIICTDEICEDKVKKIQIFPFAEKSLTPVGYDLRVGNLYSSAFKSDKFKLTKDDKIIIDPRDTVLITTLESINMPTDRSISALILSKVSKVSEGLSHISTTIDPDWKGPLLIAMNNHSKNKVELNCGDAFCTVVFFENKSPSTKKCGKEPGRNDLFMKQWIHEARKVKQKEMLKTFVSPGIIILSLIIGYSFFGNNPGFIATTAAGVAISQIIKSYLD